MFSRNLFKAAVIRSNKTIHDVATIIGCNEATLYRKMQRF